MANQNSPLSLEDRKHDILSKEMLVEDILTCTEVQNSYSSCNIYANGVDGCVPESSRRCTEGTGGCRNSAEEILHSDQSADGSLKDMKRTNTDSGNLDHHFSLVNCQ